MPAMSGGTLRWKQKSPDLTPILGFHVNDWWVPLPDPLLGRDMVSNGVTELQQLRRMVDHAGYTGPMEEKIFNQALWDEPGEEVLERVKKRHVEHVLEPVHQSRQEHS